MSKGMYTKITLILILAFLATNVMGCWSRKEVEELEIASLIAIDKVIVQGEEVYRITIRTPRTGQLGLGQTGAGGLQRFPSWLTTGFGKTPQEAFRNISTRSPREVFLAHSKFIVIGENIAKEGVQEIIDIFLRQREIRLRNWIIITKGEGEKVLEAEPELEVLLSEEMTGIIETTRPLASIAVAVDLKDFASALATTGRDVAVAKVEIFPPPEATNQLEVKKTFGADPSQPPGKTVRITGAAIFKEDKLVGYIGDQEARGLLYVLGEARQGVIPVKVTEDEFSYEMTRSETEITSKVEGGEISFDIKVHAEGDIGEHLSPHKITPEEVTEHERLVSKDIKMQIEHIIEIAQKDFGADIFGFGEKLRRQNNKEWKKVKENWREVFPNVKVKVTVEAKIRRTGMVSDPLVVE